MQITDKDKIEEFTKELIRGTTTRFKEVTILYLGNHAALVKFAGSSYSTNGGQNYCPTNIELYDLIDAPKDFRNGNKKEVHEGRASKLKIAELIESAKTFDETGYLRIAAKKEKEIAEKNKQEEILKVTQDVFDSILKLVELKLFNKGIEFKKRISKPYVTMSNGVYSSHADIFFNFDDKKFNFNINNGKVSIGVSNVDMDFIDNLFKGNKTNE